MPRPFSVGFLLIIVVITTLLYKILPLSAVAPWAFPNLVAPLSPVPLVRSHCGDTNQEFTLRHPDDVHARLEMIASAEGKGFYEWLKEDLIQTCPDEETLLEILRIIREDRAK